MESERNEEAKGKDDRDYFSFLVENTIKKTPVKLGRNLPECTRTKTPTDLIVLHKGVSDIDTSGLQEGENHATTKDELVDLREVWVREIVRE